MGLLVLSLEELSQQTVKRFEGVKASSGKAVQAAESYNSTAAGISEAKLAADEALVKATESEADVQ